MARKPRKYYKPKSRKCRARIRASMLAHHARVREALAILQQRGDKETSS